MSYFLFNNASAVSIDTYTRHWWALPIVLVVAAWTLYWKGRALWLAAHKNQLRWFIALLIINTAGILEILYIFSFSKKHKISS